MPRADPSPAIDIWHLAAQIPTERGVELVVHRPLAADEQKTVLGSAELLGWLTSSSRWNPVRETWRTFQESMSGSSSATDLSVLNRQALGLVNALRRFDVQVQAAGAFLGTGSELTALKQYCDRIGWSSLATTFAERGSASPTRILELAEHSVKAGQIRPVMVLSSEASTWLGLQAGVRYEAFQWLQSATALAGSAHAELLRRLEGNVTRAVLVLQRLAADIVLGRPILMNNLEELASNPSATISPRVQELFLEHVPMLMLEVNRAARARPQARTGGPTDAGNEPGPRRNPDLGAEVLEGSAEREGQTEAASLGQEQGQPEATGTQIKRWRPVDPVGLFRSTQAMTIGLEERWSNALARAIDDEELAKEMARWQSLIASEAANMPDEGSGIRLPNWPLRPADVLGLQDYSPADASLIAHLYAVAHLTESMVSFQEPAIVIDIESRKMRRWWQAGGFARLRDAAELLLRSAEELGEIGSVGTGGVEPELSRPLAERALITAGRCLDIGAPEAALSYLIVAYGGYQESAELLADESTDRRLIADQLELLLPAIRAASVRFGNGSTTRLREVLPLARVSYELMHSLVRPRIEIKVVAADG